jgi:hypothetical protein
MANERSLFAGFFEALLDGRDEVAGNVVSNSAVLKFKAFLHLFDAFREGLEAAYDLKSAARDIGVARDMTCDEMPVIRALTFPYCPWPPDCFLCV